MNKSHILPLTSIRFFAAIFVLFSHLDFFKNTPFYFIYVKEGFIGVTLFFILSGFVLSYSYQEKLLRGEKNKFAFYTARIARIYPLHILTLLFTLLFLYQNESIKEILSNIFLLQALIPKASYYFSLNAPSWSISVELFFYLCFPFLITKSSKTLIKITVIILILKILLSEINISEKATHAYIYISPILRLPDFIIGILIFRLRFNKLNVNISTYQVVIVQTLSICLFLLFIYYSHMVNIKYRFDIYYIIPMSILIISLSYSNGIITKILSNKTLVLLGESSFSLYMIHQLIIRFIIENKTFFGSNFYMLSSILAISIFGSIFIYKYYELPMKKIVVNLLKKV
ncbi:acyltransferase [Proteus penneri]|uniref:acyltransferase family protein n=1 Tax=Proteus penneri TaxID=102862 RepID=UPI0020975A9E|nr:acyltransferase [Proteus penneri]